MPTTDRAPGRLSLPMMIQWMSLLPLLLLTFNPRIVTAFASASASASTSSLAHSPTAFRPLRPAVSIQTSLSPLHDNRERRHRYHHRHQTTSLSLIPRGGAIAKAAATTNTASALMERITAFIQNVPTNPTSLFNATLLALAFLTLTAKIIQRATASPTNSNSLSPSSSSSKPKPAAIRSLQRRFLSVFWLLRLADWCQGPYFYDVYVSKLIGGVQASVSLVSRLFLTGFASTAAFGPTVGRLSDQYGRKKATLAFTLLYALGAMSTKSVLLKVLFAGRVMSGIGTSLLFSAPESWLVAEAQNSGMDPDGQYLSETFGLAYAGDSIVAICAGQMAAAAATARGSTGPFELSTVFLVLGGVLAAALWGENKAASSNSSSGSDGVSIREAASVVRQDSKIMLVGAVQSLFEAAMYIFVLQWPPAMSAAIQKSFGSSAVTPYGTIFSCFMASCLLGSTLFGQLTKMAVPTEKFTVGMLSVATVAMSIAAWSIQQGAAAVSLPLIMASFFFFEACVGMYFPSIGTLRSRYVPDSHRSVIMNLFGIPLNVLVVSVFLSIQRLGVGGALSVSSGALGVATLCSFKLRGMVRKSDKRPEPEFVI